MSLIKNNARVAAQIAVALANLQSDVQSERADDSNDDALKPAIPVVIGGSILDVHHRVLDDDLNVSSNNFLHERFTS